MSIQRYTRSFILLFSLLSAIVLLSPPTNVAAASNVSAADSTATATESSDMTVGEAFSHDSALKQSVLDSFNVNSDSKLSTLFTYSANLYINTPVTDFQDLIHLKGAFFSNLSITNQDHLSGKNFYYLLDLLKVDPDLNNFIEKLNISKDHLTNADFSQLCKTLAEQPFAIWNNSIGDSFHPVAELNVMNNDISDFSPLTTIYNFQSDNTNRIGAFYGWGQKANPRILPAANVINNEIALPVRQWYIYKLAQADYIRNPDLQNIFHTDADNLSTTLYYRPYKNDTDNTDVELKDDDDSSWGQIIPNNWPEYSAFGERNLSFDLVHNTMTGGNRFNSLDFTKADYQTIASSGDVANAQSHLDELHITPSDGQKLSLDTKLFNIPSGTSSVKIRALFKQHDMGGTSAGYTETYEIPLNWESSSTHTSPANNISSSSASQQTSTTSTTSAADLAPKQTVVYATKKIALYGDTNFSTKTRQQWYPKQPRIYRPMFKVTGYAQSTQGRARYLVKDVNYQSKTYGDTGYITTKLDYVVPVYYHQATKQVTVINPKGVNAYRQKNLTGKVAHYRQGQTLRVKRLVKHNLTTRYVLTNGHYITANKKLVQTGHVTVPKRAKAKTAINRYRDVNFRHRQQHYRKRSTLKITGWDYSQHGTKRYRVAHGYITANQRYIKAIQ